MNKSSILKAILFTQLIQGLSFGGVKIPDLPPKDKEELDGTEPTNKRPRFTDDEEESMEDEDFAWKFQEAVSRGNLEKARGLLETYPDGAKALLDATYGDHPVEVEAYRGNEKAVAVLLELARLNAELEELLIPDPRTNHRRRTALHHAVERGYFRVVRQLLASPFVDRFYVFEDTLMPLDANQLVIGMLDPSHPQHVAPYARRALMRRLIIQYRPEFAEVDVCSAVAPVEVAFLDADLPRMRQLLMQGTPLTNPNIFKEMLFKLQRITTEDEFNDFYMNHMEFMAQFSDLMREVENGTFFEAMLTAHLRDFPDAPQELLGYLARDTAIRFDVVERTVAAINAIWREFVQNHRLGQIRRFNQAAPATIGAATSLLITLLVRGLK